LDRAGRTGDLGPRGPLVEKRIVGDFGTAVGRPGAGGKQRPVAGILAVMNFILRDPPVGIVAAGIVDESAELTEGAEVDRDEMGVVRPAIA
jgi:hypothetical protein